MYIYHRRWALCWRRNGDENADLEKGQQSHDLKEEEEEKKEDHLQDVSTTKYIDSLKMEEYPSSPKLPGEAPLSAMNPVSELPSETDLSESEPSSESSSVSGGDDDSSKGFKVRKWPTAWYWQFLVLLVRTFRQSRHIILSKLNILQTVLLTAVASVIWFQLPDHEDSISDRTGFVSVQKIDLLEC